MNPDLSHRWTNITNDLPSTPPSPSASFTSPGQTAWSFSADILPDRVSVSSSKLIFCPSRMSFIPARLIALTYTKASSPPLSG
jgi:hypothetical protein